MAPRCAADPWFSELTALADDTIELRLLDRNVDMPAYHYAIHLRGGASELGRILRGRRYAARACRLLRPVARLHGVAELWIITSPDNLASRRTAELAGGEYVDTRDMPPDTDMYARGMHQARRYRWTL